MTMRAAVLGTGLIGTSVAIGLRHGDWEVSGWDPDTAALEGALRLAALDRPATSIDDAVSGADLVVAAGPADAIVAILADLRTEALVTDVAGVKLPIVEAASHLPHFVGGHPMAGRETTGPQGASGSLFRGALWILTSDGTRDGDVERMKETVTGLGAVPVVMTARSHDDAVALSSHLPHVVATALVRRLATDPQASGLAGGGFRDLTRIAMSEPGWWTDVLAANGRTIAPALRDLASDLIDWAEHLETADRGAIRATLAAARDERTRMAPPVATVGVLLEDEPGEIARVGHALSTSHVDLRDLQLRHAVHGGGGVLTLSVRQDEAEGLRAALRAEGFRLME